jgi:uncharacterized membrane protein YkoI
MRKRTLTIATGLAGAALATGGGIAWATSGGDEQPLTGSALERATAAALRHTGGGTVTETETGDDGAAYGVEVRLADGTQVEVNLDASFHVIGQARDDDGSSDKQESGDD